MVEHHLAMVGVAGSNPVFRFFCTLIHGMKNLIQYSDYGAKDIPVPISNTEVKLRNAESSWGIAPCEGRTLLCMKARIGRNFNPFLVICVNAGNNS